MQTRRLCAGLLGAMLGLTLGPRSAEALQVLQVTRHGYIVTDEADSPAPLEGTIPVSNTTDQFAFIADLTAALDAVNAPQAPFIAAMQLDVDQSVALAFYLGLSNDTLGLGMRSPLGGGASQTFDLNPVVGTTFPVTGFVFLNGLAFYTNPGLTFLGQTLICTQEFGHRWGPVVKIPPQPGVPMPPDDAGAPDASMDPDASVDPDASMDDSATPDATVPGPEASVDAGPAPPVLPADSLLGRQRAHWTYFMNTGGSPMEGNAWTEITPGVFRTSPPSFVFSQLDLYLMGLVPTSEVPPFWLITNPNVMGQNDMNGHLLWRESPPEYSGRTVTIRGQRDTYAIEDIVRANGPRVPAYRPPAPADAGADSGASRDPAHDMQVLWVLLVSRSRFNSRLAATFDTAISTCADGFNGAAQDRIHLVANTTPLDDAGVDSGIPDASADGSDGGDGSAPRDAFTFPTYDAADGSVDAYVGDFRVGGGCGCHTTPARGRSLPALLACATVLALAVRRRRRAP